MQRPDNEERRPTTGAAPRTDGEKVETSISDQSPLRRVLAEAMIEHGLTMKALTVLEKTSDPFRIDTPGSHRDGSWFATAVRDLGFDDRTIHLRGLHYMILGRTKPDGAPYTNTAKDWAWLIGDAGQAARWLGYIGFDQITDHRNAAPVVREFEPPDDPWPYLATRVEVKIPDVSEIRPRVGVLDFVGVQPYKIVLAGEKSSLEAVLGPVAEEHQADLYLPTGYMSDTMVHRMAKVAATDGRPMVLLYFADCDPDGWHMPVVVARKLQGFKTLLYPDLDFEVHRVGLTPDQVREFGLPSTPLKTTNQKADGWRDAMGVEQTEIDALASLQPDLLRRLAVDAIDPFYDRTLEERVGEAEDEWIQEAQAIVDEAVDDDQLDRIRTQAAEKLDQLSEQIDAINQALQIDADDFDLPIPAVPEARLDRGRVMNPLSDSRWSFADQTLRLIASKEYRGWSA